VKTLTRKIILPEWTKYVAQDCLGIWWAFECLPVYDATTMGWDAPDGGHETICDGVINKKPRQTLLRISHD